MTSLTTRLQVGDRVRVLDTEYTRSHGDPVRWSIGKVGEIRAVHDVSAGRELTGYDTIYDVEVRPYSAALIDADLELVERKARIV
jgi:hypothetical protein